jgi:SAM-dependent methyltransferase
MVPEDSVLVDFGCGKGRVLLIAAECGFRKARGVEFAHELCEIADKNCAIYKRKRAPNTEFQVIESDAAKYVLNDDENVFFMFNPFDDVVLNDVLNNIAASLKIQPRKILILYFNPLHGNLIEQHGVFAKSEEFVIGGYPFPVYSNSESLDL